MKKCEVCRHYKTQVCYFREVDANGDQVTGTEQYCGDICQDCIHRFDVRDMWESKK